MRLWPVEESVMHINIMMIGLYALFQSKYDQAKIMMIRQGWARPGLVTEEKE